MKHKHYDLIIAWANGAKIQCYSNVSGLWADVVPNWYESTNYRIKPEPKPDTDVFVVIGFKEAWYSPRIVCSWVGAQPAGYSHHKPTVKFKFDGETGKIKSVELIDKL